MHRYSADMVQCGVWLWLYMVAPGRCGRRWQLEFLGCMSSSVREDCCKMSQQRITLPGMCAGQKVDAGARNQW
jgi:hypothetical protein